MKEGYILETKIAEYQSMERLGAGTESVLDSGPLIQELIESHDWTPDGAKALMNLVQQYGAFMLRNALALAVALQKEDGDLNF